MKISRRDTLRLATALAATRAMPFAVSPQDAAAMLAQPAVIDPGPGRAHDYDLSDPVSFAESLDSEDFYSFVMHGGAQQWAAYKHALLAVEDAVAEGRSVDAISRLLGQMDNDAVDMATLSAFAEPFDICDACQGYGRLRLDRGKGRLAAEATDCSACGGSGTVSAPRPVISLQREAEIADCPEGF